MLANVGHDPTHQSARIGVRRFDQERDLFHQDLELVSDNNANDGVLGWQGGWGKFTGRNAQNLMA
jgi:hypothetical protein